MNRQASQTRQQLLLSRGQWSILLTFYSQLLRLQSLKAQKDSQHKQLLALSESASVKAAGKHVDQIDPKKRKKYLKEKNFSFLNILTF